MKQEEIRANGAINRGQECKANALNKALALNPDLPDAWFAQGMSATIFGAHADAEGLFLRGIEAQPRSSILHAYLGLHYGSHRRPAETVEFARRAAELDPQAALIHGINRLGL